jgi:hypothetical protein
MGTDTAIQEHMWSLSYILIHLFSFHCAKGTPLKGLRIWESIICQVLLSLATIRHISQMRKLRHGGYESSLLPVLLKSRGK